MATILTEDGVMVWFALKRDDLEDSRTTDLQEVHIPRGTCSVKQILAHSFRLDTSQITLKIRNNRGSLIPVNFCLPPNTREMPYILEVAKNYQHVSPRRRSVPMTVIHKTLGTRLQNIQKRIDRLEEHLPQLKMRHQEKMTTDIDLLMQKLVFLHKRMQGRLLLLAWDTQESSTVVVQVHPHLPFLKMI